MADIQAATPTRSAEFKGDYRAASSCAAEKLTAQHSVTHIVRDDLKRATLLNMAHSDLVMYEARLTETRPDVFRAEVRSMKGVHTEHPGATAAWAAIESCAAKV